MKAERDLRAAPPANASITQQPAAPDLLDDLLRQRPRGRRQGAYQRGMRIVALLGVLLLAAAAWYAGAYFTLIYLASTRLAPFLVPLGAYAYGIPVIITAIEISLNPRAEREPLLLAIWALILAFDALTSAIGLQLARGVDTTTITVPLVGTLGIVGAAAGIILAFGPEKIGTRAITALWAELRR